MELSHLAEVASEQSLLHRLGTEEVESQGQKALVLQYSVVARDHRLQLRFCTGVRIMPQHGMEDGHKVALARAERAREERASAHTAGNRVGHESERLVERLGESGGDDVGVEGALDVPFAHAVGEP